MKVLWFLYQLEFDKRNIILDVLNWLVKININLYNNLYLKLNTKFFYNIIFIKVYFILILKLFIKYNAHIW